MILIQKKYSTHKRNCKSTRAGIDYMGTISHTVFGSSCQFWSEQSPHNHTIGMHDEEFPDKDITAARNYCRNPDQDSEGPWCYTTEVNVRHEYCMIPVCSEPPPGTYPECKLDRKGMQYRGKMNLTWRGDPCIPWTRTEYVESNNFPDVTVDEALNYCRNPQNETLYPWCYKYTKTYKIVIEWEYCMIHMCSEASPGAYPECKVDRKGLEYHGTLDFTWSSRSCMHWVITIYDDPEAFPDDSVDQAFNYCRNPTNFNLGPWCIVDTRGNWEYCMIPICSQPPETGTYPECKVNRQGVEYQGRLNHTWSAKPCVPWVLKSYQYSVNSTYGFVDEALNYCRNPTKHPLGPFCHTGKSLLQWEYCKIHMCSEPTPGAYPECKIDRQGMEYQGKQNHTWRGQLCLLWTLTPIIKYQIYIEKFPDNSIDDAFNYCRNPTNSTLGPWCYTKNLDWEYCAIHMCSEHNPGTYPQCKLDRQGMDYQGKINHTWSGRVCAPWTIKGFGNSVYFPDKTVDDAFNYCRNPSRITWGPFCYTNDKRILFEFCEIPMCNKTSILSYPECKLSRQGIEYQGKVNHTWRGVPCVPWTSTAYAQSDKFPDKDISEVLNYCRNPGIYTHAKGPWCFTNAHQHLWQYCLIPMCSEPLYNDYSECKEDREGLNYHGKVNITWKGNPCIPWSFIDSYDDIALVDESLNYCRNPVSAGNGPFCHIFDDDGGELLEPCAIPICGMPDEIYKIYKEAPGNFVIKTLLWELADLIHIYIFPLVVLIGTIFNILSIYIFSHPSLRSNTTAFLLIVLAIADTLSLYVGAFDKWLRIITDSSTFTSTDLGCQLFHYSLSIFNSSPGWVLLVITLERVIKMTNPHVASTICTKINASKLLIVSLISIMFLYIPTILFYQISGDNIKSH